MNWIRNFSTGRNVMLAVLIWLTASICLFNFGPYAALRAAGGGDLLEERFGYSEQQAQSWLGRLGEIGRVQYRRFQFFDLANACLMALAMTLLLSYVLQRLFPDRTALQVLICIPALVGILEWLENLFLLKLTVAFPAATSWMAKSASWATSCKLTASFLLFPMIVVGLVTLGVKHLRRY